MNATPTAVQDTHQSGQGSTPSAVLGLFEDPDTVADALDALRAAGYQDHELTVLSDMPYPEGAFGERETHHNLHRYPLIGAFCGLAVALLVTIGTQLAYPMVTGGKPILSIPPMLMIAFEGTLLGAVVVTILGILLESRLPSFRAAPYDPRITEGYLGVVVTRGGPAERMLREAGAIDVVTSRARGDA
jgi:hypothetical protein